jgi:hypothetical protein
MKKSDLQITINIKPIGIPREVLEKLSNARQFDASELHEQVAASHKAFSSAGLSVVEAGAALAAAAPHFRAMYDAVQEAVSQYQEAEFIRAYLGEASGEVVGFLGFSALDKLGIEIDLIEHKAQQRAQLILLLAFVLLTLLVSLL